MYTVMHLTASCRIKKLAAKSAAIKIGWQQERRGGSIAFKTVGQTVPSLGNRTCKSFPFARALKDLVTLALSQVSKKVILDQTSEESLLTLFP